MSDLIHTYCFGPASDLGVAPLCLGFECHRQSPTNSGVFYDDGPSGLGVITATTSAPRRADRAHGRAAGETGLRFFGILGRHAWTTLSRPPAHAQPRRQFVARLPNPAPTVQGPFPDQPNKPASTVSSTCCRKLQRNRPADGPICTFAGRMQPGTPAAGSPRRGRAAGCGPPERTAPGRWPGRSGGNRRRCAAARPAPS